MRSNDIDLALYCPEVAKKLVSEDERFIIYGPAIMNAEVLVYQKKWLDEVHTIGIAQGRKHLKELVYDTVPHVEDVLEITPKGLNYAMGDGQIDGAIMDISKASLLKGYQYHRLSEEDYISYVLVTRKSVIETKEFERFIDSYNKVGNEIHQSMQNPDDFKLNDGIVKIAGWKILLLE